jgi:uncharacterized membrane protein
MASIVSSVSLVRAVLYYAPKIVATPRDPGPWTSAFEVLAIAGASWILVGMLAPKVLNPERAALPTGVLLLSGRVFFAASLIVFGVQHLVYGRFVAGLVPRWIPGHLFWAYFVGAAFLLAALGIVSGRFVSQAGGSLGSMFLLWVLILHAPGLRGHFTKTMSGAVSL